MCCHLVEVIRQLVTWAFALYQGEKIDHPGFICQPAFESGKPCSALIKALAATLPDKADQRFTTRESCFLCSTYLNSPANWDWSRFEKTHLTERYKTTTALVI